MMAGCSAGLNSPQILSIEIVQTEHAMREILSAILVHEYPAQLDRSIGGTRQAAAGVGQTP